MSNDDLYWRNIIKNHTLSQLQDEIRKTRNASQEAARKAQDAWDASWYAWDEALKKFNAGEIQ